MPDGRSYLAIDLIPQVALVWIQESHLHHPGPTGNKRSLSTCLRLNNMLEMNHSISGKKHNQLITGTKMKLLRYVVAEYWKIGSCSGRSWKWLLPCPVYHPMVGKYHTRFKESMYIYIYMLIICFNLFPTRNFCFFVLHSLHTRLLSSQWCP